MKKIHFATLLLLLIVFCNGCISVNKEELSNNDCKFTESTYTVHVQPILQNNCIACHSGIAPAGNFDMASFQQIKNRALSGILSDAINHRGEKKMPNGLPKLSDCNIKKIDAWIAAGAKEN